MDANILLCSDGILFCGSWIVHRGSWIQNSEFWILDSRWLNASGKWTSSMLVCCRMSDVGCRTPLGPTRTTRLFPMLRDEDALSNIEGAFVTHIRDLIY